ncbi:MAG: ribosome biogenesis GTPase Der [bacterium]
MNQSQQKTLTAAPIVAIVGRPNVGKSTLFNRILSKRIAIVSDQPGVTRDRNYRLASWRNKDFLLVDMGGLIPHPEHPIEANVKRQVEAAIEEATIIIMVVDAAQALTSLDHAIAEIVRNKNKPYLLVANKMDTKQAKEGCNQVYELGLGEYIGVSAEHGTNIGELLDCIVSKLPDAELQTVVTMSIAITGRPNVGKSTLVNSITGKEVVIVDEKPGTTRDAIDTIIDTPGGRLCIIDTAGLKRKAKTKNEIERYSAIRSLRAIDRSDVVVLMLDCEAGIAKQDLTIASYVESKGKGIVIVWNKWDLRTQKDKKTYTQATSARFRHMAYAPVLFISCLKNKGIDELIDLCFRVNEARNAHIQTGPLNRLLLPRLASKPPGGKAGKKFPKVYYITQIATKPPTFTLFVNQPELFGDNYIRFIEKEIRELFDFTGCPIRIKVRKSK